jgi:hypothetical protein
MKPCQHPETPSLPARHPDGIQADPNLDTFGLSWRAGSDCGGRAHSGSRRIYPHEDKKGADDRRLRSREGARKNRRSSNESPPHVTSPSITALRARGAGGAAQVHAPLSAHAGALLITVPHCPHAADAIQRGSASASFLGLAAVTDTLPRTLESRSDLRSGPWS